MSLRNVTSTLPDPQWVAEVERELRELRSLLTNQAASIRSVQSR